MVIIAQFYKKFIFFFFIFDFHFSIFPQFFCLIIFHSRISTSTISQFNSNSIKSYKSFLSRLQIILTYTLVKGFLRIFFWYMGVFKKAALGKTPTCFFYKNMRVKIRKIGQIVEILPRVSFMDFNKNIVSCFLFGDKVKWVYFFRLKLKFYGRNIILASNLH